MLEAQKRGRMEWPRRKGLRLEGGSVWHAQTSLPSETTALTRNTPKTPCICVAHKEKLKSRRRGAWPLSQVGSVTPSQFRSHLRSTGQSQVPPVQTGGSFYLPEGQGSCLLGRMGLTWLLGSHFPQESAYLPLALPSTVWE